MFIAPELIKAIQRDRFIEANHKRMITVATAGGLGIRDRVHTKDST